MEKNWRLLMLNSLNVDHESNASVTNSPINEFGRSRPNLRWRSSGFATGFPLSNWRQQSSQEGFTQFEWKRPEAVWNHLYSSQVCGIHARVSACGESRDTLVSLAT
jgi:hypothetical protein